MAFVVKVRHPTNEEREDVEKFQHTIFDQVGAYLVWGAKPVLDALVVEHKKELTKYNQRLGRAKIPLRIRLTHSTVSRGKKYVYCGRYLYKKSGEYVSKLDNAVLRNELKERWNSIGPPPANPLDGLQYRIFIANGGETDHVIVPYHLYHDPRFNHLFIQFTRVRLGSE